MKTTAQNISVKPREVEALDERLEAIKDILIGDTFQRLEKQMKGLNHMMDTGNSHLVTLVDDLSREVVELKSDLNRYKADEGRNRFEDDEEIRNAVHKLNADFTQRVEEQNEKLNRIAVVKERIGKLESEAEDILKKVTQHLDKKVEKIEANIESRLQSQLDQKNQQYQQLDEKNQRIHTKLEQDLKAMESQMEFRLQSQKQKLETSGASVSEKQVQAIKQELHQEISGMKLALDSSEKEILKRLQQVEHQSAECESKMNQRIESYRQDLERKIAQGGNNNELIQRQNRFEKSVGDLMENMAVKVSSKLGSESEARTKLSAEMQRLKSAFKEGNHVFANEQESLKQRLNKVEQKNNALSGMVKEGHQVIAHEQERVNSRLGNVEEKSKAIKDVFEKDIFKYLENLTEERSTLDNRMQRMQEEFGRQMHEASLRMETRMETMMEMNQRYLQNASQAPAQKSKKDELKETLKKLTELLDD